MWFFEFLGLLIIFSAVLFLAYITTKFVGQNTARSMKGKNMEVIETLKIGVDKQLYLVRAGDKYVLLSSSGKNIQFLSEVNVDEEAVNEQELNKNEFKGILDKYLVTLKPSEGFFRKKNTYTRKDKELGKTDFANNIRKLQNINQKINSEDVGHEK